MYCCRIGLSKLLSTGRFRRLLTASQLCICVCFYTVVFTSEFRNVHRIVTHYIINVYEEK